MNQEGFKILWDSLSQERKDTIHARINATMTTMVSEGKIKFDKPYNWNMNFPFDREEPIQYTYIEGVFGILNGKDEKGELRDAIVNQFKYIEISDDVDNYLDRKDEIKEAEELMFKVDSEGTVKSEVKKK